MTAVLMSNSKLSSSSGTIAKTVLTRTIACLGTTLFGVVGVILKFLFLYFVFGVLEDVKFKTFFF